MKLFNNYKKDKERTRHSRMNDVADDMRAQIATGYKATASQVVTKVSAVAATPDLQQEEDSSFGMKR